MEFRTMIEVPRTPVYDIRHDTGIVMLGSCFTDNIGALLLRDGFKALVNPLGPLYNPASIGLTLERALTDQPFSASDMVADNGGNSHCLWFASRYQNVDADALASLVNDDFTPLCTALSTAEVVILTLGTSYFYRHKPSGHIVGNCHKFAPQCFSREMLTAAESADILIKIITHMPDTVKKVILTVSPVRHTADTLHGNQLSKAQLLMAVDEVVKTIPERCIYFPAYEILLDDLRDYRFYAADMKHPSSVAADYIYDIFTQYFFSADTVSKAAKCRKEWQRSAHRQIIQL